MNGVKFGNYHSFDDLGLVLSSKSISAPEVKVQSIEIPGADGSLDLTDFFGEPKYKNRSISFSFVLIGTGQHQLVRYSFIKNLLHGRKMKIVLDADSEFYYIGRLSVGAMSTVKNINRFAVECDCEPYKYKVNRTVCVNKIENHQTLVYVNERKSVVPTITVSDHVQFTFDDAVYTFTLQEEKYADDRIVFKNGNNVFYNVTGSGSITVEYQEGSL